MQPAAEVILSPALIPHYDLKGKIVVVIDILRATTTICHAFKNGAERILPIETIDEAKTYLDTDYLVAAERNGLVADGFTMGNSPESFSEDVVKGKSIVLTTTNGTYSLHQSKGADKIIIGAFSNISAVAARLMTWMQPVTFVCAGWKNKFNLEDTIYAGAVLYLVKDYFDISTDACTAALNLYLTAAQDLEGYLRHCNHAQRFEKLGINDLPICLKHNVTHIVPEYDGKYLVAGE